MRIDDTLQENVIQAQKAYLNELTVTRTLDARTCNIDSLSTPTTLNVEDLTATNMTASRARSVSGTSQSLNVNRLTCSQGATINGVLQTASIDTDSLYVNNLIGVPEITANNLVVDTLSTANIGVGTLNTNTFIGQTVQANFISAAAPKEAGFKTGGQARRLQINNASNPDYDLAISRPTHGTDIFLVEPSATPTVDRMKFCADNASSTRTTNVLGYNLNINSIDDGPYFGGIEPVLSLCASASRTMRFQQDGAIAIYSSPNTMLWSTNTQISDATTKINIAPVDRPIERLRGMPGVYFNYDTEKDPDLPTGLFAGVIAQRALEMLPEAVTNKNGACYLGVNLEKLVPVLVESVKELRARNKLIASKIKYLEGLSK